MNTRLLRAAPFAALTFATLLFATPAFASTAPLSPHPAGAEIAFVRAMQSDLPARFRTVRSAAQRPWLWGVNAQRWVSFRAHVHYVLVPPQSVVTSHKRW
jgi:hypothetical protein